MGFLGNGINLLYFSIAVVVDDGADGGGEVKGGEVPRFEFRVTMMLNL